MLEVLAWELARLASGVYRGETSTLIGLQC
jgi:hypothetical protein